MSPLRCCATARPPILPGRQKPHIGTDLLRGVIRSIRREIESLGGTVRFDTALTGFTIRGGRLAGVETTAGAIPCERLILGRRPQRAGHFAMLSGLGLPLACKPFFGRFPRRTPAGGH